jgi:hypothetical protein
MPDSIHNGYCLYETCSPLHPENIKIIIEESPNIFKYLKRTIPMGSAELCYSLHHGLINYADTEAFVGFSHKLTCRKIFRH